MTTTVWIRSLVHRPASCHPKVDVLTTLLHLSFSFLFYSSLLATRVPEMFATVRLLTRFYGQRLSWRYEAGANAERSSSTLATASCHCLACSQPTSRLRATNRPSCLAFRSIENDDRLSGFTAHVHDDRCPLRMNNYSPSGQSQFER